MDAGCCCVSSTYKWGVYTMTKQERKEARNERSKERKLRWLKVLQDTNKNIGIQQSLDHLSNVIIVDDIGKYPSFKEEIFEDFRMFMKAFKEECKKFEEGNK
jgi:hypothetical protein